MTIQECVPLEVVEDLRTQVCDPTPQDFISHEFELATGLPEALSHVKSNGKYHAVIKTVHAAVNRMIRDSDHLYGDSLRESLVNSEDVIAAAVSPRYFPSEIPPNDSYSPSEIRWIRLFRTATLGVNLDLNGTLFEPKLPAPSISGSMNAYDIMRVLTLPPIDRSDSISVTGFRKHLYEYLKDPAGLYAVRKRPFDSHNVRAHDYRWIEVEVTADLDVRASEF
ncbi:MAG TPA: hypothetical protein VLG11_04715 [Candidatus Saccharimonadales bacterium]|nr:hypothetical protein [Candidatus Saccharimonadales bacterium]